MHIFTIHYMNTLSADRLSPAGISINNEFIRYFKEKGWGFHGNHEGYSR